VCVFRQHGELGRRTGEEKWPQTKQRAEAEAQTESAYGAAASVTSMLAE
jgi:hypothetical protein